LGEKKKGFLRLKGGPERIIQGGGATLEKKKKFPISSKKRFETLKMGGVRRRAIGQRREHWEIVGGARKEKLLEKER